MTSIVCLLFVFWSLIKAILPNSCTLRSGVAVCNALPRPRSHGPRPLSPARLDGMVKGKRHEVKAQKEHTHTQTDDSRWLCRLLHAVADCGILLHFIPFFGTSNSPGTQIGIGGFSLIMILKCLFQKLAPSFLPCSFIYCFPPTLDPFFSIRQHSTMPFAYGFEPPTPYGSHIWHYMCIYIYSIHDIFWSDGLDNSKVLVL
jgi:hypothetical protein